MTRSTRRWLAPVACCSFMGCMIVAAGAQTPPKESKGQKAKELCAIDLTAEIDSGTGRRLRLRVIIVGAHDHCRRVDRV